MEASDHTLVAASGHARAAAAGSLALLAAAAVLAVISGVQHFPDGLAVLACLVLGIGAAGWGIVRTGAPRLVAIAVGVAALVAAIVLVAVGQRVLEGTIVVVCVLLSLEAGPRAFAPHGQVPPAPPPQWPGPVFQPQSGRREGR